MFKLKRENDAYLLTDIPSNIAVAGKELANLLIIAEITRSMREQLKNGQLGGVIKIQGPNDARAMGKNTILAAEMVQQGLRKQGKDFSNLTGEAI